MAWLSFVREAASAEAERVRAQVRAAVRSAVLALLAGVILLVGIVFALAGLYGSLAERMPDWQAGGWIGLGTLVICLLLLLMAKRGSPPARPPAPRVSRPQAEDLEATAELGAAASTAAREFVRTHRPSGIDLTIAAFVVGMIASRGRRSRD